jgi:RHS repeat-associated protein
LAGDTSYEIAVRGSYTFAVRTTYDTAARDYVVRLSPAPVLPNNWLEVRYDLDSSGRTQRILPQEASPDTLTYVPDGLVTGLRLHGAVGLSYQTRPGHDLARVLYTPGALHSSFGADFIQDTVGRTVQQVKGSGNEFENYTYDVRGRLTAFNRYTASPTCPATDTLSEYGSVCTTGTTLLGSDVFTYDPAGNRTDKNALIDAAGRLVRFNGDSMLYDADGNLTRRYRISDSLVLNQRLYWNSLGQLDSVRATRAGSTQTVRFGYDGFGRRVRKSVGTTSTYYVFSGSRVIGEYTGSGSFLRAYAYQPGIDHPHAMYQAGVWHYYVTDGRGNVRGLLNSAGTVVEAEYKYVPYGDTVSTTGSLANSIRFAGREHDAETGFYYARARYYDPTIGRFVSEDAGALIDHNRYSYAASDPVNQRDPSGRACEWADGVREQAPPVALGSISFEVAGGTIVCDDESSDRGYGGGWGGWSWNNYGNAGGDYFCAQALYDPLYCDGRGAQVDFTPIGSVGLAPPFHRFHHYGDSRGTPFNRHGQCLDRIPDVTLEGFDQLGIPWTVLFTNLTATQPVKADDKVVWYSGNVKVTPSGRLRWKGPTYNGVSSGTVACKTGETIFDITWG